MEIPPVLVNEERRKARQPQLFAKELEALRQINRAELI
jgi:hypothetical protein